MSNKNNKTNNTLDEVEEAVYESLLFTNLTSMTGDLDNTSQNLFLYYNTDDIKKEIEERKRDNKK